MVAMDNSSQKAFNAPLQNSEKIALTQPIHSYSICLRVHVLAWTDQLSGDQIITTGPRQIDIAIREIWGLSWFDGRGNRIDGRVMHAQPDAS